MISADQWLQVAPTHWTRGRLKNLIASATNGTWGSDPAEDGSDVHCVRAADFDRTSRRVDLSNAPLRNVDPPSLRQHLLRHGDLILEKSGGGEKQPVGMAVLFTGADTAVCSNFCARISASSKVDPRFLTYVFAAAYGQGLTQAAIKQTTGIQNLDTGVLFSSRWAYPQKEEQRRIADFLDAETYHIDTLMALRGKQAELLDERLASKWSAVMTQDGSKASWVPIRRFITAITDGPFGSSLTSAHYSDSGARVIRLGNLGRAEFRERDAAYIPSSYFDKLRRHEALPGDLIVAGLGDQNHPLGRACLVPEKIGPAMVKADCFRLRLDQTRMLHEYAAWALSSPPVTDNITLLARGSTRARINLEVVREILIPAPPLEQQHRSVATLAEERKNVRNVARRCMQQFDLLTERRQALITAAVTGQFDVSTASGRGVDAP